MNRLRKKPLPSEDAAPEPTSDPAFDLRQGLIALVIFIAFMVVLTLICVWIGR